MVIVRNFNTLTCLLRVKNLRLEGLNSLRNGISVSSQGYRNFSLAKNHLDNRITSLSPVRVYSSDTQDVHKGQKNGDSIRTESAIKVDIVKPSRREKLKKAVKEYGSTVIVFHIGISLASLGACYLIVSAGLDTSAVFSALGLIEWAASSEVAATAGTFAVAYAVHKVFAPIRIAITLASVPFIVRYLRRIGFLKKCMY